MKICRVIQTVFPCVLVAACSTDVGAPAGGQIEIAPLRVQSESQYVTDPNQWGRLVFERDQLEQASGFTDVHVAIADAIEGFHSRWLNRENEALAELLDEATVRVQTDAEVTSDVLLRHSD